MARSESKGIRFIDALVPWLLTPALIYVGIPVVFVSLITMLGLAMVHPLAAMIVPLGIGATIGAGYKRDAFPPALPLLSRNMRLLLLGGALGLGLLAVLASSVDANDWRSLEQACYDTCLGETETEADFLRWIILCPALTLAPMTFLAAVTGSRRAAIALLGTSCTLLPVVLIVLLLFLMYRGAS